MRRLFGSLMLLAGLCGTAVGLDVPQKDGWSVFPTYAENRTVYVSTSEGSDKNKGGTPDTAVRSLQRAMTLVKPGSGGAIYLKRGDVWKGAFGNVRLSGESPSKPLVISTYGEGPRPVVSPEGGQSAFDQKRWPLKFVAIEGIDFSVDGGALSRGVGITMLGPAEDVLIENCRVQGFTVGILMQGFTGRLVDVTLRRCVIADSNATGQHSQGLFVENAKNLRVEECVFDHNGWREEEPKASPTVFNHNVYIMPNVYGVTIKDSIFARGSSHGVQARSGGNITDNLFLANPLSLLVGGGDKGRDGGVTGKVVGNVLLSGGDIGKEPRGWGIEVCNVAPGKGLEVRDNIIAHSKSKGGGMAIIVNGLRGGGAGFVGAHNITMIDNIVWKWGKPLSIVFDDVSAMVVRNNVFATGYASAPYVEYRRVSKVDPERINYAGNRYVSPDGQSDAPFRVGLEEGGELILSKGDWKTVAKEEGAAFDAPNYADPARDVVFYQHSIGGEESIMGFLAEAREQTKGHWRGEYTAGAVLEYIRAGFEVESR